MDKRTQEKLSKVGRSIPIDMLKAAMRTERTQNTEKLMYDLAKSGRLGEQASKQIMDGIKKGEYAGKTQLKVNESGSAEIAKFTEAKVKQMVEKGEIPKPKQDSWMKKMADKFR